MENEREVIEKIKNGERGVFSELVDKYKEKAINIAFSFCGNYEDARDISQEAFIKVFKTIKSFRGECQFYTWFYRILINLCKDYLRQGKMKYKTISLITSVDDEAQEEKNILEVIASPGPDPQQQLLNKELSQQLSIALASLPEQQKKVFILKNIHGFKISEISEITKCAQGTIKAHLFKATLNLKEKLAAYTSGGTR